MKYHFLHVFLVWIILFINFNIVLHAQEGKGLSVLCKIMDTKGHPLANVNVSIDERDLEPSDENGLIIIHQFNPSNKPKKIFAFKEGIELASWGMKKGKIEIIMRESKYKLLFGEVLDLEGDPIVNQEIIFLGKKNAGSSKTDEKGKFKMIFPIETELNENSEFLIEEHSIYHRYFEYKGIYDFKLTIKKNKEGKYLGKFYNGIVLDSSNNPISNVQLNIGGYNYLTNEYGKFKAVLMNSKEGVKAEGYKIVKLDSSTSQNKINLILERDPQYVDLDNTEEKLFSGILDLPTLKRLINDSTNVGEDVKYLLRDLILENIVENIDEEEKINQGLNKVLSKLEGGHDLSKSEKDSVKIQLTRLDKLIQVKKVGFKDYEETLSLIENLKLSILEKEERLSIIKDQKELAQAEFQRKLTIISGITVFLAFLVIVFVVLARKLKKRKNELTLFKSKLELTIGDLEDNNLKITDSIRYAQTIQYAILPQEELMRKYFSDIFIIYRPKDIVSGDFYWFANAQNDSKNDVALIAVVDCTGHGVPGAFMSLIGNTILNEIVDRKLSLDTDEILELLDKEIVSALKQDEKQNDDGMDICLCKLEKVDDNITKVNFTGAKRPLYYIISKDHSLKYLKGDNKMIGGLQKKKRQFTSESFFLQKGDMLYLSTDGYVDQNNKENLKIGKRKFADLLQEVVELPLNEQKRVFEDKLDTHQNGQEQRDDITLIGIKI